MTNLKDITRRDFLKISGASIAAGILNIRTPQILEDRRQDLNFQAFRHGRRDQAKIALSFDDCHLVTKLQDLEKLLRNHAKVKVTFFPTGEALLNTERKDSGIWQRFIEAGHEIGSHTFDHVNPGIRSTQNLVADYSKWLSALYQVTESKPTIRFARPPFGALSPSYQEMCIEYGLVAAMWSANWGGEIALAQKNIEEAENGDIALLHTRLLEIEENTPFALSILEERGIRAVTMSELYLSSVQERIGAGSCSSLTFADASCPE
ncbi:MAG: polysaccharide deacetylase family protein [Anaerolineae bacterium]|jgi:peptidoglycan-N-acetylglucosamine deacetylase|nr:polysaccharide deacetylase family protein [Anaerolineae bacterium]MBT7075162.1 polysaccharide deacetylase family protein [Anaerolineae bacterium]MBT7783157.1 polysaccharide deacetylase family protein [Anaerolineae bacterium]